MVRLLLVLLLSGCATEVIRYQSVPLPVPSRPELPTISRAELQCLSDDVYSRLAYTKLLLKRHIEVTEGVIKSTHGGRK